MQKIPQGCRLTVAKICTCPYISQNTQGYESPCGTQWYESLKTARTGKRLGTSTQTDTQNIPHKDPPMGKPKGDVTLMSHSYITHICIHSAYSCDYKDTPFPSCILTCPWVHTPPSYTYINTHIHFSHHSKTHVSAQHTLRPSHTERSSQSQDTIEVMMWWIRKGSHKH